MARSFRIAKVRVFHQDCFASESIEKFPEVTLLQRSNQVIHQRSERSVVYTVVWEVKAPSKKDLEEYLAYLRGYPGVLKLDVLAKMGNAATVLIRVRSPAASYDRMLRQGVHYTSPVKVVGGLEEHNLLVVDTGKLKSVLDALAGLGEVKLAKLGRLEPSEITLTPKQQDALAKALKHGYYDWPKKVTLEELAELEGIHRRTFHERLRLAEAKLIPRMLNDFELL